jgi:hypothetical protein
MRLYHRTSAANAAQILRDGFRDSVGYYLTDDQKLVGVCLSDRPLDSNEGAWGDTLLRVELPDQVDIAEYECVEDGKPYREWLVPAELINTEGRVFA